MEKNPDIIWELNIVQTEEERARVDMLADQSMDFRYYETDASQCLPPWLSAYNDTDAHNVDVDESSMMTEMMVTTI